MSDNIVQLPKRTRKGLGLATVSEAFVGSASWLEALASMLEKEASEFELDPAFIDILLHKTQFEATQVGLRRIAAILRTLEADVRRQGGTNPPDTITQQHELSAKEEREGRPS